MRELYLTGMQINGNWQSVTPGSPNKYLYNGKELHDWAGLNWEDYGARWYIPELGRFTGVDPIAAQYAHVSTYNYAENEPIRHIDLWGLQKVVPMTPDKNGIVSPSFSVGNTEFQGRNILSTPIYRGSQTSIGPAPEYSLDPVASTVARQLIESAPMVVEDLGGTAVGVAKGILDLYRGDNAGAAMEAAGILLPGITGSAIKKIHGNSLLSKNVQHGYEIFDQGTGEIMEYGISGQNRSAKQFAEGASPRIGQKLNTKYGNDPNFSGRVIDENIGNRKQGIDWEKGKVNQYKSDYGEKPKKQIRP